MPDFLYLGTRAEVLSARVATGAKILENFSPCGLSFWSIIRTFAIGKNRTEINHLIIMEKKELYVAPAVRFCEVRFEGNLLTSAKGPIDDWTHDDDEVDF